MPDFYAKPDIKLFGAVNDDMVRVFHEQLEEAIGKEGSIILELTTTGGDAEGARRMALDIMHLTKHKKKDIYFLGKTVVYSAGITLMGAFPKSRRYITEDAILLIHERRMDKKFNLKDLPLQACSQIVQQLNAQIKMAQKLEEQNFERLAEDTKLSAEEIAQRALNNWYITADEALELGLVAGIV